MSLLQDKSFIIAKQAAIMDTHHEGPELEVQVSADLEN
jgi:hypothetical protein